MLRVSRSLIDAGAITEDRAQQLPTLYAEASTLGLGVGDVPRVIACEVGVGNGQDFRLTRADEQGFTYKQALGCLTLIILND